MDPASLSIACIQVFETCVSAYRFAYTAQHVGTDGNRLRSKLQWEQLRLEEWGKKVGLESAPTNRLNWQHASDILKEEETLLTSASKLRQRYHLNVNEEELVIVEEGSEDGGSQNSDTESAGNLGPLLGRLRSNTPLTFQSTTRSIQSKNNTFRKIQWALIGKTQISSVANELKELNDRLYFLLDTADREWLQNAFNSLLRDIISRSHNVAELTSVQSLLEGAVTESSDSLDAVATLKRIRLAVRAGKRLDEEYSANPSDDHVRLREIRPKKITAFQKDKPLAFNGLEAGWYHDTQVLVEWKNPEDHPWSELQGQVQRLATVLSKMGHASFYTFPFIGLVMWQEQSRFGLVFDKTCAFEDPPAQLRHVSLTELLQEVPQASLSGRIKVGRDIAEAILQLHTAGWLHKGIRSDNIVFLSTSPPTASAISNDAHVVGFEYSRPDSTNIVVTELPSGPLFLDLYRHPDTRGHQRQFYQKHFDMYALACVLLELALWQPLVDIISPFLGNDLEFKTLISKAEANGQELQLPSLLDVFENESLRLRITHNAGAKFHDAILTCLSEAENVTDSEASLEVEKKVLELLRSCIC